MHRFFVVIEKANGNYSAYSPDLPGCVTTGATREEAEKNMHEAIEMHVKGLLEDKLPIPESQSFAEYVSFTSCTKSSSSYARWCFLSPSDPKIL
jgi:predicted RNase H-like HicB family nuclease